MHIEPGIVDGAKIALSYVTAAGVGTYALATAWRHLKDRGVTSMAMGTVATTAMVLVFFEVLPHFPVGVSEVHLILGSTLFLLFGAAPAAFGLALGLLIQGMMLSPFDLPQYGMNVTTLLVPLFALQFVAARTIAPHTRYTALRYRQVFALSATYQAGIVSWVTFWALYGAGFSAETLSSIATFGAAYALVIVAEPLVDLAVLAAAKSAERLGEQGWLEPRLFNPA
ncbi:energy-coupling factor ABC transporter permease [Mycobacterium sp. SMC-4]|uniref:energy-coupling factor ABC transporter permease n=1 Tax=Mycobacterium sp. SMC-4 TaxID=2857059 RepID=UPI0021B19CE2|nr:energy-coupling factor ABC transporter permease [Mycobacterium sp. SMC-4]UXA18024.1 energy-coupling factor ABC transporter permease [Mycobacterium sp. SMC-4]